MTSSALVEENTKSSRCILVTGAAGQIGTELLIELRKRYGNKNVIGMGHRSEPPLILSKVCPGPFIMGIDVCNRNDLAIKVFDKYPSIDTVYHLAAILSGTGEQNPMLCWRVNMDGTLNILEECRKRNIHRILIPSSVAVFGPETPSNAPQDFALHPTTMYGITKVSGELLGNYYCQRYPQMCIRGLRLPGIISVEAMPGGGTTDYAVQIFYDALQNGTYECFLGPNTKLPMMYMPDCIRAMIDLIEYSQTKLKRFCDFNVSAFSFTPAELALLILKYVPDFKISYKPDFRQSIADSWPDYMQDIQAREQWGWKPKYTLQAMVEEVIHKLKNRELETGSFYPLAVDNMNYKNIS